MDFYTKMFLINIICFLTLLVTVSIIWTEEEIRKIEWLAVLIGLWFLVMVASIPSYLIYIVVNW